MPPGNLSLNVIKWAPECAILDSGIIYDVRHPHPFDIVDDEVYANLFALPQSQLPDVPARVSLFCRLVAVVAFTDNLILRLNAAARANCK